MYRITKVKIFSFIALCTTIFMPIQSFSENEKGANMITAITTPQIFEKAKENTYWKNAFLTGKNAQIVFMNISPSTNPNNEVGMETHKFDQVIFVVEGSAKAVLNGKSSMVESGDMIFIPQGVAHNVINVNEKKPLKIMSVYSDTDIPENSIYKTKSDTPPE